MRRGELAVFRCDPLIEVVQSARALLRVRLQGGVPESRLADARRESRWLVEPVRAVGAEPGKKVSGEKGVQNLFRSNHLSPEMVLRIEIALGPKAEVMMGIQTDYALARARQPEITATGRRIARDPDRR